MKHSDLGHGLFLVLHDAETGRLLVDRRVARRALAVAAMAGLLVAGRLTVADDRVLVRDRRPRGGDDPVSAFVLGTVAHRRTGQSVDSWADVLGESVYGKVAGELVGAGVLSREQTRRLITRGGERYPAVDVERAGAPRLELRHMVHTPRAFDLPGAVAVAVLLRLGVDDVLGAERVGPVLLGDLLDHVPPDLRQLVAGLVPGAATPTTGGAAWTEGPFAGSRFLVEAAVLDRRSAEAAAGEVPFDLADDGDGDTPRAAPVPTEEEIRAEAAARADAIAVLEARNDVAARLLVTRGGADPVPLLEELAVDCAHLLGPSHPDTLIAEGNLAVAYLAAGRPVVGTTLLITNLTDREAVLGDAHPATLSARETLATVHRGTGRTIEAVALSQLVAAQRTHVLGPAHPDTLASRLGLGLAHTEAGDHTAAAGVLGPAAHDAVTTCGPTHPVTLTLRAALADCQLAVGRTGLAREGYRSALGDAETALGPHHPDVLALRAALDALPARTGGQVAGV